MRVEFYEARNYLSGEEPFTRVVDIPVVPQVDDEVVFESDDNEVEFTVRRRAFIVSADGTLSALVRVT